MSSKSIKDTNKLKYFEVKKTKLTSELELLKSEISNNQKTIAKINKDIQAIEEQINAIKTQNTELVFSEHSILRYIERVMGIDIEELKEKILTKDERRAILNLSKTMDYNKDDFIVKIKDNVIITVLKKK